MTQHIKEEFYLGFPTSIEKPKFELSINKILTNRIEIVRQKYGIPDGVACYSMYPKQAKGFYFVIMNVFKKMPIFASSSYYDTVYYIESLNVPIHGEDIQGIPGKD